MPTVINGLTGIDKIQSGAIDVNDIPDGIITLAKMTPAGTSGQVLTSAGTGSAPTWADSPSAGGLGIGQTWQNVTASRVSGTTYTNSTGKPIMVAIKAQISSYGQSASITATVGGVVIISESAALGIYGPAGTYYPTSAFFIVPNNTTYVVTYSAGGSTSWTELR